MKRLTILGLLTLSTCSFVSAEEYVTSEYYEEVTSQPEIVYGISESETTVESNISMPLIETTTEEKSLTVDGEIVLETNSSVTKAIETKPKVELSPYLQALEKAKSEDKTIMLAIRATNCHYCDRMEAETLSKDSVEDALAANFVTVYYNQDLEPLPLGLQAGMTPTFVFVNTHEDILNMYPGMRTPEEFKEVLEQILSM